MNTVSKPLAAKTSFLIDFEKEEADQRHLASPSVGTPQAATVPKKGSGRGNWNTSKHHPPLLPNPVHMSPSAPDLLPDSVYLQFQREHLPTSSYQPQTRNRPLTSHQKAVSDYRRVRIQQSLDTGIRRRHIAAKRQRQEETIFLRAWKRIRMLPSGWDSEDEGTADKGKEDTKDKDKDKDDGGAAARKSKEEEKAAAALRRAAGGARILGGFTIPLTDKELELEKQRPIDSTANVARFDVGEEAMYMARAFTLGLTHFDSEDHDEGQGKPLHPSPPLKPIDNMEDEREMAALDELAASTTKPRQGRKSRGGATGAGASRKPKGGATKLEPKDETPARPSAAPAEDEDMHDEGDTTVGPSAELDDDERELLGEADTEDEEEDEDNMDEDT